MSSCRTSWRSWREGDEEARYTPALVFCFNRNECWSVAEQLKGKRLLADGQQKLLVAEIEQVDWSIGAGGKLKQFLMRGVGIHHAGLLPKYRRIIEKLFQKKLLSICVCTETLAAGINLPARSVVMTSLLKGPPRAMKLIEASSAHQMFGRAGRPQFDTRGYVFAVAHEDDVRMFRWQQKYDEIPEDTKDPMLLRAKKILRKRCLGDATGNSTGLSDSFKRCGKRRRQNWPVAADFHGDCWRISFASPER